MRQTMIALALLVSGGALLWSVIPATASCTCACVDGQPRPVCTNSFDMQTVCPQSVCPLVMAPVQVPQPSVTTPVVTGTQQNCADRQVYNPQTGQNEWRRLCQ